VCTSYVAEGTILHFPPVAEGNTDLDTSRGFRALGAIPSTDTCSVHSSDPTPRVITKLPHFGGEEDAVQGFRLGAHPPLTPALNLCRVALVPTSYLVSHFLI